MVGELHLGLDLGPGLEDRGHVGVGRGLAGRSSASARRRSAASSSRRASRLRAAMSRRRPSASAGVGGQVTGHLGQVVVPGPAEAHRPGQRRGGRPGQVPEEVEPGLHGGVLVVERLDGVAAPFGFRAQPRGLFAQRIGAVAAVDLDVQQGQAGPAGRDPDRRRIHGGRQAADHHRLPSLRHVHRAAALHAGAVPEDGHRRDRRVKHPACQASLRLTQSPFARRRARVISGAVVSV